MQGVNEKGRRGINIRDEASVSVHDNSLIIEQNIKKICCRGNKGQVFPSCRPERAEYYHGGMRR
ncbi:hypothetical protein K6L44_07705 [Gluconacetobacter entanii]|uniref:hypothetical protein n=1 Tax=Gluconacetobacter entanii TaxID=108528 RepID=UPI001C9349FC|nr:hypothetical protein [Gluconacetobacter entanii]MBY4639874.1 hypothetical protein [Gluconacetobacter entanii]MCW4581103.1 hypothetical protein [Gluconacetobacter entanii]MCW4584363.1 hypothetical protein [Gluconacetobacter entanii]MCW4587777.1 hypothetical protein [Gluconacetobacter entanii]